MNCNQTQQLRRFAKIGKICRQRRGKKAGRKGGIMANTYEKRLTRVLDYIHDNPAGDLSLDQLADVAALSRFHFHRVFHAMMGETAAVVVRRMRLYRVSVALVQSPESLTRIAKTLGYPSAASLTRAFTDSYGLTPTEFRNRGVLRPTPLSFEPKGQLMYPVEIRRDPARRLACIPHQGPYIEIGRAFEKLGATLGARGLSDQAGSMIGVYYCNPNDTKPEDLRSHAGVVLDPAAIEAPLEEVQLRAGRHAVLTYEGPYAGLTAAYQQLFGVWLPQSGEEPADAPSFEIYLNTPMDTAPDDLLTELCLPLV
jgi:AraC family transcriptional regulator